MITSNRLIKALTNLGFIRDEGRYLATVNDYKIVASFECKGEHIISSHINYGDAIIVSHQGVCNFTKDENLVQLECVLRVLKIGYSPDQIELEKTYTLGHTDKGRLDILVKKQGIPWLMIECKTPDKYEKEIRKVEQNGSQIFSYYAQDRTPALIGVYASDVINGTFDFYQISTQNLDKIGSDKDIFKSWDGSNSSVGVLCDGIAPYECEEFNLRKTTLKDLSKENGTKLYNRFMEILRRHAISDKSNALIFFSIFLYAKSMMRKQKRKMIFWIFNGNCLMT